MGGGTGMICHWFKGGIGTSSRKLSARAGGYTVGVLVQCNYGSRRRMAVLGAPVGQEMPSPQPCYPAGQQASVPYMRGLPSCGSEQGAMESPTREGLGSIIVVVATDAPLLPHQLKKLARRVSLGLGRDGGLGENSSGDIFLAFSTMPLPPADSTSHARAVRTLEDDWLNPLYEATVSATEESIVNAMLGAEDMKGADDLSCRRCRRTASWRRCGSTGGCPRRLLPLLLLAPDLLEQHPVALQALGGDAPVQGRGRHDTAGLGAMGAVGEAARGRAATAFQGSTPRARAPRVPTGPPR